MATVRFEKVSPATIAKPNPGTKLPAKVKEEPPIPPPSNLQPRKNIGLRWLRTAIGLLIGGAALIAIGCLPGAQIALGAGVGSLFAGALALTVTFCKWDAED